MKRKHNKVAPASAANEEPLGKRPKKVVKAASDLLIDKLHSDEAPEALKEIADSVTNDYDKILELLSQGGGGKDILALFDRDEKPKSPEISLVFNACETFLLYLANQIKDEKNVKDSRHTKLALEVTREILEQHLG